MIAQSNQCSICHNELPKDGLFCQYCDPPLGPEPMPESVIGFAQTFLQILIVIVIFSAIFIYKTDIPLQRIWQGELSEDAATKIEERPNDPDFKVVHFVNVEMANVRETPSPKGRIVLVLNMNNEVDLIESQEEWSKVVVQGKTGWIGSHLLGSKVSSNEQRKNVQVIKVSMANIRSKPSRKGRIIMVLNKNEIVRILERRDKWSQIEAYGKMGWIRSRLLKYKIHSDKSSIPLSSINVPMANIRLKPRRKGRIVMVLNKNDEVRILERKDKWSRIKAHGKIGWIRNSLLNSNIN